ncbi:hypothetical protein D9R19_00300 [Corynebacterium diphtheriae]|nr:hypothetical protein BUE62_08220 [Corynebacterium diphtheriae]OSQ25869.1 hypothetical protein B9J72_08620 [Corynebacterium diphtheriae]QBY12379.1 hypothetical protein E4651_11575 [Corynebacterium diphtheriae]RKW93525.1 hypothetical protein D9B36_00315 [Corynebacterium diphtheriae]RLP12056.1 hypothetical protein D9R17_00340 [Corynebacterium diphtheriae]
MCVGCWRRGNRHVQAEDLVIWVAGVGVVPGGADKGVVVHAFGRKIYQPDDVLRFSLPSLIRL